ncbi:unnamed protein product [Schistosoma guineensis]|nr:unnamed protein product [Schistosoma guineensis]
MLPDVSNSSWKYKSRSITTNIYNISNSSIIPYYTKEVFIFLSIEIAITLLIIMILSILFIAGYLWNSWTVFLWVLAWSAFALAMLIIFYQKIRDENPLNIFLLVIYSIWIGTAIGISVLKLCMYLKVIAIAITLISFICSIFIGAAIRTRLADQFLSILIYIMILSAAFVAAAIVFYVLKLWVALIALDSIYCWKIRSTGLLSTLDVSSVSTVYSLLHRFIKQFIFGRHGRFHQYHQRDE